MSQQNPFVSLVFLALCGSFFAACSSDDTSSDAAVDSGNDATSNPDGASTPDSDLPDGTVDSSLTDAGATCDDSIRNGDEEGVDCGGSCPACDVSICEMRPSALYCDAFEDNAFNANPWNIGQLELSDDAYHGNSALAASVNGEGNQRASVEGNLTPLQDAETYFARAYVKIPASATIDQFDLFALRTLVPEEQHCSLAILEGKVSVWCTNGPDFGTLAEKEASIARDRWMCVEWSLELGANGLTEVFVDGTRVLSVRGNTSLGGPVTKFHAGIEFTSESQGELSIKVDELILDAQRVGCDS